jgi:hypothetical protein
VEPLPSHPDDMLVLQVLVTRAIRGAAAPRPLPDDARLISVKGRKEW